MAYSIQYNQKIKRKSKRDHKTMAAILLLLASVFLRIFLPQYLQTAQFFILPQEEMVAAFCEDFVNHDWMP